MPKMKCMVVEAQEGEVKNNGRDAIFSSLAGGSLETAVKSYENK
jgi:hypothetical protein